MARPSNAESLSWAVGPEESRLVRVLLYLAEGFFGGGLVAVLVGVGRTVGLDRVAGTPWVLAAASFAVLPLAWKLWTALVVRSAHLRTWLWREWLAVHRWWWALAAAVPVGGALSAVVIRSPWYSDVGQSAWFGALFVSLACALLAGGLCSKGRIDSESMRLTTIRYGEWRDVDLRTLTVAERVALGPFSLLWLSVSPGVEKRTATQGVYAIPESVLDGAWPAFEAGLDAPVPFDDETVERGRFFRRVNRAVALGFGLLALGVLAVLAWLGSPPVQLLLFCWAFGGFGFLLLKLAA